MDLKNYDKIIIKYLILIYFSYNILELYQQFLKNI